MVKVMVILHAYQPAYPIQEKKILDRIVLNCYQPFIENLLNNNNIKIILNFTGSLTEILIKDYPGLLKLYNEGIEKGQIELLQTPAYHPILPLIGKKKREWHLQLNKTINKNAFGDNYNPRGIFPPELAVSYKLVEHLNELDYGFIIMPENSIPDDHDLIFYFEKKRGRKKDKKKIHLIPRNKKFSNAISFQKYKSVDEYVSELQRISKKQTLPVVIAMDLETFGKHNHGYWKFLFDFLNHNDVITIHSNEYLSNKYSYSKLERITSSSWSTDDVDLKKENPFPLWADKKNIIHKIQQEHLDLVHKAIMKADFPSLEVDFQKQILASMHSCQFWWASGDKRWSTEMILKGFNLQREVLGKLTDKEPLVVLSEMLHSKLLEELRTR